jgi:hypothetical protein
MARQRSSYRSKPKKAANRYDPNNPVYAEVHSPTYLRPSVQMRRLVSLLGGFSFGSMWRHSAY